MRSYKQTKSGLSIKVINNIYTFWFIILNSENIMTCTNLIYAITNFKKTPTTYKVYLRKVSEKPYYKERQDIWK